MNLPAESKGTRLAALVVERNGRPALRLNLPGTAIRLGRHLSNDLVFDDDEVAEFIGEILATPNGSYYVVACQGHFVDINGKQLRKHFLEDGDRLRAGAYDVRYVAPQLQTRRPILAATGQITLVRDKHTISLAEGILSYTDANGSHKCLVGANGVRIGKDAENDLVVAEASVSGFHALVFAREDRYFVRDLESTNGTLVNGLKVVEAEVPFGATIRLGRASIRLEKRVSEAQIAPIQSHVFEDMVSYDAEMRRVFSLVERIASHEATVCITGETGTGKELMARALHNRSARATGPFVALNVSAIPNDLVEDELFGHEKGAFSGAERLHPGAFEQAQNGTLFLDEIGELPLNVQAKLLRVLETREVRRIGSTHTQNANARVVCATHRDLVRMVEQKRFREDLLHRIFVLPVHLPPLRDRRGDVELLCEHFMATTDPRGITRHLSPAALEKLRSYRWPGNIRELRNVLTRAILMTENDPIGVTDLTFLNHDLQEKVAVEAAFKPRKRLDYLERQAIVDALESAGGNRTRAAQILGIHRSTLNRKLSEHEIEQ